MDANRKCAHLRCKEELQPDFGPRTSGLETASQVEASSLLTCPTPAKRGGVINPGQVIDLEFFGTTCLARGLGLLLAILP